MFVIIDVKGDGSQDPGTTRAPELACPTTYLPEQRHRCETSSAQNIYIIHCELVTPLLLPVQSSSESQTNIIS